MGQVANSRAQEQPHLGAASGRVEAGSNCSPAQTSSPNPTGLGKELFLPPAKSYFTYTGIAFPQGTRTIDPGGLQEAGKH